MQLVTDLRFIAMEVGGKSCPVCSGYRPQFYVNGRDYCCTVRFSEGVWVQPGESVRATIIPSRFAADTLSGELSAGLEFQLREGTKTVATGTIVSSS